MIASNKAKAIRPVAATMSVKILSVSLIIKLLTLLCLVLVLKATYRGSEVVETDPRVIADLTKVVNLYPADTPQTLISKKNTRALPLQE